jgi:hypothetical protein
LIGDFNGTFRLTGNYRIQWPTIAKYSTPAFGIDAPLFKGLRKNDWISVGLTAYQDKAGEDAAFQLKRSSGWIGGSYHAALNSDGVKYFRWVYKVVELQEVWLVTHVLATRLILHFPVREAIQRWKQKKLSGPQQ